MITFTRTKFFNRYLPIVLSVALVVFGGFAWLVLTAPPARAAIAFVNAVSNAAGGGTPATGQMNVTTGNLIYVVAAFNANGSGCGSNTLSVSDNLGNTYTPISGYMSQSFNCARNYYAKNINGNSSVTITVTDSINQAKAFTAMEISGLDTTAPLDANTQKFCSASPCTSAAFTTTQADEIVLDSSGSYYGGTWTAGSIGGNTATIPSGASQDNAAGGMSTAIEYYIFASTQTSITASLSKTGTIYQHDFVATFKAAAGGGGGGGPTGRGATIQNVKVKIQNVKIKLQPS